MSDRPVQVPPVTWFGDRAVLVALADPRRRAAVVQALSHAFPAAVVRPGMDSAIVQAPDPDPSLRLAVEACLSSMTDAGEPAPQAGRTVTIPVVYNGSDVDDVARLLGRSTVDVVAAHTGQAWQVAMMGFAPGFGYLVPVGQALADWDGLARRVRPRAEVPAGSVAVAAGMSAVYPSRMPGGWHLLGRTDIVMFDPGNDVSPSFLLPGDTVMFTERPR
jgi:KipI family sensor histidine kinase inhibitor